MEPGLSMAREHAVQTVDRALVIVDAVAQSQAATLSEIAARASLHESTALRLLAALWARGWVQQNSAGQYSLGPYVLGLTRRVVQRPDLREVAHPHLEQLQQRVGEDVH